ncbi:hypothetical protein KIS4809_4195 [Bacillus sp. ZZV12-4809]|nr:hypothetical protein KIS4809_4195 [Bacillus sp. ZZV12-4809]
MQEKKPSLVEVSLYRNRPDFYLKNKKATFFKRDVNSDSRGTTLFESM